MLFVKKDKQADLVYTNNNYYCFFRHETLLHSAVSLHPGISCSNLDKTNPARIMQLKLLVDFPKI